MVDLVDGDSSLPSKFRYCQLFFYWIKLFGIHLPTTGTTRWRPLSIGYSLTWLLVNTFSHFYLISTLFLGYDAGVVQDFSTTSTFSWNRAFRYINWFIHDVGCHLSLVVVQRHWPSLRQLFVDMENSNSSSSRKYGIAAIAGLVYIFLKEFIYMTFFMPPPVAELPLLGKMAIRCAQILTCVASSSLVLYGLLTLVLAGNLNAMANELATLLHPDAVIYKATLPIQLNYWKKWHIAICECAEAFNRCFGLYMLVETCAIFVGVINLSFYILIIFMEKDKVIVSCLCFLVDHLFRLWVLTHSADSIHLQVKDISCLLSRLKLKHRSLHEEIAVFVEQVRFIPLKLNASGYFRISRKLLLKLIGTFLTYFIVLYQFQSSERNLQDSRAF